MRRRDFSRLACGLGAAALTATVLPVHRAMAESGSSKRKFIFVVNYGGWDPTRVFAPEFDNAAVDMERDAETATLGELAFVDHAARPSVRSFLETWYAKTLFLKGVLVPSVAHENCLRLCMTGTTRQDASDWPAIVAGAQGTTYALPHVVAAGPSFPGTFGAFVTRTGTSGQLPALLDGSILSWSDLDVRAPSSRAEDRMNDYLKRRIEGYALGAAPGREADLAAAYQTAQGRAESLKDLRNVVDWSASSTFSEQTAFAADVLSLGISRCVTVSFSYYGWDTHIYNDLYQSGNFEVLFAGLSELMTTLSALPGEEAPTLAEETVVVVLSEMGRTPQLNSGQGKDHWPYTSMMLVGPGITGGRVVGAYDPYYYGKKVDLASGEIDDETGDNLSSDVVGATLLALADVDSEDELPGVARMDGVVEG